MAGHGCSTAIWEVNIGQLSIFLLQSAVQLEICMRPTCAQACLRQPLRLALPLNRRRRRRRPRLPMLRASWRRCPPSWASSRCACRPCSSSRRRRRLLATRSSASAAGGAGDVAEWGREGDAGPVHPAHLPALSGKSTPHAMVAGPCRTVAAHAFVDCKHVALNKMSASCGSLAAATARRGASTSCLTPTCLWTTHA